MNKANNQTNVKATPNVIQNGKDRQADIKHNWLKIAINL